MKAATIADVARAAGVSCSTASRALNGGRASSPTVHQVRQAADRLGYRPSYIGRMLSTRKTENIAAVIASLERRALTQALRGLQWELARWGASVTVIDVSAADEDAADAVMLLRDRDRFDGVVLFGASPAGLYVAGDDSHPPTLVSLGDAETAGAIDPLAPAVDHLERLGHRRVHYIGVDGVRTERTDYDAARETSFARLTSGRFEVTSIGRAEPTVDGGFSAAVAATGAASRQPTALIAGTAEIAAGAAIAARELGLRVPQDVSIIGIEESPVATLLGLTTVDVRSHERGRLLAFSLQEGADTREHPGVIANRVDVRPLLRPRTSTAPASPSSGAWATSEAGR